MEPDPKENKTTAGHAQPMDSFIRRVIFTLISLVAVTAAVVFLLVYMPLKSELENSLMDNFYQVSFIRYTALQSSMDRGLEGARSLSSRTVIRDAVLDYLGGDIDKSELKSATQHRYEDGARALKYLIRAERYVDGEKIAEYISESYMPHSCTTDERLIHTDKISTALCLTEDHSYFALLSPLIYEGRIIAYDKLIFDLSYQISLLSTGLIHSELIYHNDFVPYTTGAKFIKNSETSALFYRGGFYHQSFLMHDKVHFVSLQSADTLLEPVSRLSRQTLLAGMGLLVCFAAAVYMLVIRLATDKLMWLEDTRRTLTEAVTEANIDPLTEVGGRRYGEEFLTAAFDSFRSGRVSPAVLLFDIDGLKQINDSYGHSVGDRVLHAVAQTVEQSIRGNDVLMRWGGDEFIGIFEGLGPEYALSFARKLLRIVSGLSLPVDGDIIRPTISIGVSYFRADDSSFLDAINRADRAMYRSKAEGKNKAFEL